MERISPRGVVPVSKNVVQMMQTRLEDVEESANQLTKEIMTARQQGSTDRFSILLSKTQSMESVLQSLKLQFVNLSTLTRQPSDLEQKLVEMTDIYSDEMKKLSSENSHLKTDKQEIHEKRQQLEIELQRCKLAVEDMVRTQNEKEEVIIAEKNRSESLLRKVAECERQLNEERHLRFALDKANGEMSQRFDEMESILKQEHIETQSFTADFVRLKKDLGKKTEELKYEKQRHKDMEKEMLTVCAELDTKLKEFDSLKKEKDKLTSEMSVVHDQYQQLNTQLEAMQNLFNEYQKEKSQTEDECTKLNVKIEELNSENTKLTQDLIRSQANDESARLIDTRQQLRQMTKHRDQLQRDNEELNSRASLLESTNQELDRELDELKEAADKEAETKYNMIGELQERLATLKSELLSLEGEKVNMLTEVHGAVDAMDGERSELQAQIESYKAQLSAAMELLEEERTKSQDSEHKLLTMDTMPDLTHFDRRLAELTEQKNSLSYENGKLQSQVEQLQTQLETHKKGQDQYDKTSKKLSHAENKLKKMKHDLDHCKHALVQAETTSQQLQTTSDLRETDYNNAVRARDEALRDAKTLAARVESLEEIIKQQEEMKCDVEERLREDNSKVAESLENMMALHTELQCKHESLQIELGKKDTQLNQLKKDKRKADDKLERVEKQFESTSDKLSEIQSKQTSQTKNVEREIKSVKNDNSKLVRTLQDTLELNEQLRAQVSILEETLCKHRTECDRVTIKSKDLENRLTQQESSSKSRIAELEAQISKERDKAYQKMEDQLRTVQKETESILERNSELLQQNSSLKSEISELTSSVENLKMRLSESRDETTRVKDQLKHKNKQSSKLKDLEHDMRRLQEENDDLNSKTKSQQKTIGKFVSQFKEVQQEMKQLVSLHAEQTELLAEKERLLHAEELRCEELRNNYHQCRKQVSTLQALQKATETKLMEANNDTLIATETLEDTNRYFKERFTALADELGSAKRQHFDLEWKNLDKQHQLALERQKMEDTTSKARNMIRASRHQLINMADKTELDSTLREQSRERLGSSLSPIRSPRHRQADGSMPNVSVDDILSVSQQQTPASANHRWRNKLETSHQTSSVSPFISSSQKLDAIINQMEKRRLIS